MENPNISTNQGIRTIQRTPLLNWDILVYLMPYIVDDVLESSEDQSYPSTNRDRTDLLSYMRTCHTLYNAAIPLLLGGKLTLGPSIARITSLCDFVLRHSHHAHHVRWLSIPAVDLPKSREDTSSVSAGRLASMLRLLRNLKRLDTASIERFLDLEKRVDGELFSALVSLPSIEHVYSSETRHVDGNLIMSLQSPVSHVYLSPTANLRVLPGPFSYLASHSQQLSTVRFYKPSTFRPTCQYPKVWDLSLELFDQCDSITLGTLSSAFPGLKVFRWTYNVLRGRDKEMVRAAARRSHAKIPETWALDALVCGTRGAYMLAFNSPVRYWDASVVYQSDVLQFQTVLRDIQPTSLRFGVPCSDRAAATEILDRVFSADPPAITHLDVTLFSCVESHLSDVALETLLGELRKCLARLSSLRVVSATITRSAFSSSASISSSHPAHVHMSDADTTTTRGSLQKFVEGITQTLSHVELVSVQVEGSRSIWKVESDAASGDGVRPRWRVADIQEGEARDFLGATLVFKYAEGI